MPERTAHCVGRMNGVDLKGMVVYPDLAHEWWEGLGGATTMYYTYVNDAPEGTHGWIYYLIAQYDPTLAVVLDSDREAFFWIVANGMRDDYLYSTYGRFVGRR